uniref:Uncharacterized protein LOC105647792 isoform X1 n=2 Tax=Rhizophora mucronata TaxID=61149 RepID=A0A2P2JFS3_RHIMU
MAYVPPHKRHSRGKDRPSPTPELFVPQFKQNLNLRSPDVKIDRSRKIVYAKDAKSMWFAIGLDDNGQFPSYVHLEPISVGPNEHKVGEKPLILVNSRLNEENTDLEGIYTKNPWVIIAKNVQQDLMSAFETLRNEIEHQGLETVKPTLVARFGKLRLHGMGLGGIDKGESLDTILRQMKRSLYTNIPLSYMENIIDRVVPKVGLDFEEEKDIYHVKLSDNRRPDSTVSCKCRVKQDKKLLLCKVELNQVRHLVIDISCLDTNLDLRLMLCTKRILAALTDDEMKSIRDLINSAVIDSNVKGGLRWPLGKESSGDRYSVVGVWHTVGKAYKDPTLRLKVRHADRFDFRSGTGEASKETYLKLKGVISELKAARANGDSVSSILNDNLKLIWENFLSCERAFRREQCLKFIPNPTTRPPPPRT